MQEEFKILSRVFKLNFEIFLIFVTQKEFSKFHSNLAFRILRRLQWIGGLSYNNRQFCFFFTTMINIKIDQTKFQIEVYLPFTKTFLNCSQQLSCLHCLDSILTKMSQTQQYWCCCLQWFWQLWLLYYWWFDLGFWVHFSLHCWKLGCWCQRLPRLRLFQQPRPYVSQSILGRRNDAAFRGTDYTTQHHYDQHPVKRKRMGLVIKILNFFFRLLQLRDFPKSTTSQKYIKDLNHHLAYGHVFVRPKW